MGDLVSISFHANKNMTTGEGGCLVLNDTDEAALAEKHRLQGVVRDADGGMDVDVLGGKFNLTDIAARIGIDQLKRIDAFNARRRELARRYFERFAEMNGQPEWECGLPPADFGNGNWHMFQINVPFDRLRIGRGDFIRAMQEREIGVGVHYPAIHLFTAYRRLGFKAGDFPHAERIGRETVTLPLFPAMQSADVDRVCAAVCDIIAKNRK
jgi:dTDP-4-amino-4,6-dideoxygalactose transaminase